MWASRLAHKKLKGHQLGHVRSSAPGTAYLAAQVELGTGLGMERTVDNFLVHEIPFLLPSGHSAAYTLNETCS